MLDKRDWKGVSIGLSIIALWLISLLFLLQIEIQWDSPFTWLMVLVQTHLYTGMFITAHDAMHRTVCKNQFINHSIGKVAAVLFAFNNYNKLIKKHHEHHRFVATDKDPDYHHGNFLVWYFNFALQYVTIFQIILMAITYNLLKLIVPAENLILFWMVPSILSTLQLFYFGTYLPHRGEHDEGNIHKSRSQRKNHWWAFLSCYFFGYHYEHHDTPNTPWWELYKVKSYNDSDRH